MNKKGFISTSAVLVLFLLFLFLLLSLLSTYSSNRSMLAKQKNDIKTNLPLNQPKKLYLMINSLIFELEDYHNNNLIITYNEDASLIEDLTLWYNTNIGITGGHMAWDGKSYKIYIPNILLDGSGSISDPYVIKEVINYAE